MNKPRVCPTCIPDPDAIRDLDRPLTYEEEKALALDRIRRKRQEAAMTLRFPEDRIGRHDVLDRAEPWRDRDELRDWGLRALDEVA